MYKPNCDLFLFVQNNVLKWLHFTYHYRERTTGNEILSVSGHRGFHGSRSIVPLCPRGSKFFTCGHFFVPIFFVVGVSWVRNFFSWVFRRFEFFSHQCFVGLKFFLVDASSVQSFFSWVFRESEIFSRGYFVGIS